MRHPILTGIVSVLILAIVLAAAYLFLWPVPIAPVSWHAPTPPGYVGGFAVNTRLAGLELIPIDPEFGPEHIAIGPDGKLYAATTSGAILRMEADGSGKGIFANTGGRVLGFDFDAAGRMIAADAMKGLLAIDADGKVSILADSTGPGVPLGYANAVAVAADGTIYFTQSSTRFNPVAWGGTLQASILDVIEQSATGRVLAFDPRTGDLRVVAHGISFANGLVLSSDQSRLFVNETARYRIWRIDVAARNVDVRDNAPEAQVLLDNLPGYPDNLTRGRDGRIWVGLFRPRNPAADSLSARPFLRKILVRLPHSMLPTGAPYGHVFAINEAGDILDDLQDPSGAYPETTGAAETADRLYIHSLETPNIGWLPY